MHSFARLIPQDEVLTAGKFLILVGVVLPLVPDTRLIATAPVTPYHIWLAVVAISGLSYLTYLVQRYLSGRGSALLPALLGGAYSSTATTVVLAKRKRKRQRGVASCQPASLPLLPSCIRASPRSSRSSTCPWPWRCCPPSRSSSSSERRRRGGSGGRSSPAPPGIWRDPPPTRCR